MIKTLGIIGGGNVGGTLAKRFAAEGLNVLVGVPNPEDPKYGEMRTMLPKEAAMEAEVLILATPWMATEAALREIEPAIEGKILIDATNPIAADFSGLTLSYKDSGGLQVARWAPKSRVVKAFNTIGFNIMADPLLDGVKTTLLIAGDDPKAKEVTEELAKLIGFSPLDVGGLSSSALSEITAWLWISLSRTVGREFVFNFHSRTQEK